MSSLTLLKGTEVYSPEFIGKKDILLGSSRILSISDNIEIPQGLECVEINCSKFQAIPGLIDCHVHIAGAGGEGGPKTRTPEIQLSDMLSGGITGVIGCLGTDGITRNVESVLMKAKSLKEEGVSAWILTGAYQYPPITLTGSIERDICLIKECIGVGEIAVSDHRSSWPSTKELLRLAEHARVAGMLAGKAGIVNLHMGDMPEGKNHFQPVYDVIGCSTLPITQFLPTHINRNSDIFEQAKEYGKKGGYLDITASSYPYYPQYETKPSKALKELILSGVDIRKITISSDGGGSLPDFDINGNLISLKVGDMFSIFREMREAVLDEEINLQDAILPVTANVADIYKLKRKGYLKEGYDADIVLLDKDLNINYIISKGNILLADGIILKKGTFEK